MPNSDIGKILTVSKMNRNDFEEFRNN